MKKHRFGDYCLDTANMVIESYDSLDDIFDIIKETRDETLKERLIAHLRNENEFIDLCIKEAKELIKTLPYIFESNDCVSVDELNEAIKKLNKIKLEIIKRGNW